MSDGSVFYAYVTGDPDARPTADDIRSDEMEVRADGWIVCLAHIAKQALEAHDHFNHEYPDRTDYVWVLTPDGHVCCYAVERVFAPTYLARERRVT